MSHAIYDFLADSELFTDRFLNSADESIDSSMGTLQKYIDHCSAKYHEVVDEINGQSTTGIRSVESPFGNVTEVLTKKELMSQSILQDLIILPDPLFTFCKELQNRQYNSVHYEFLGLQQPDDAGRLRKICRYLRDLTPFIVHDVVKLFPDFTNAKPKGVPILYSPKGFTENFEENILKWLHQKASVYPMLKSEKGLLVESKKISKPCRMIYIEFDGSNGQCSNFYNLMEQKIINYDEKTRIAQVAMHLPETPPTKDVFDNWVFQSINQSGRAQLSKIKRDTFFADLFKARFSPQNDFVEGLIINTFSLNERNARVEDAFVNPISFGIETPESLGVDEFLKIRSDNGSLLSFRTYLNDKLNSLSNHRDVNEVNLLSKEIGDELRRKLLPELKLSLSNLYTKEALKWTTVAASMGVGVLTQGGSVATLICLGLAATGVQTTKDNIDKLKSMPGFFWNRISRK